MIKKNAIVLMKRTGSKKHVSVAEVLYKNQTDRSSKDASMILFLSSHSLPSLLHSPKDERCRERKEGKKKEKKGIV